MNRLKSVVILGLICASFLQAEPKWLHIHSDNFELYSSANERDSRDALDYFEQVRMFFLAGMGHPPADPVPVYIVMFGSAKEYEPYKLNEFAAAYYKSGSDRDYIVLGRTGEDTARAAVHEYVHLVTRHARLNFPIWLNEGIADLYSTLRLSGGNITWGDPLFGRLQELRAEKWVPLQTILTVERDSPYYNESKKAGSFYAESWALTHMLLTTNEYRSGFPKVETAIRNGVPSVDALEQVYGKPLAKIEEELRFYVSAGSYHDLVVKAKLDVATQKWIAEPASMFDVRLAQANLLDMPGTKGEARARLQALASEDAKRPEPWAGLGYLTWREGDQSQAAEQFGKAYELGDRSAKLLWDYGRLTEGSHPDQSQRALVDLVALQPLNVDARMELAAVRSNQRHYGEALDALAGIKDVTPEQAPRLFSLMGAAQIQIGQLREARATAGSLTKYAKTDSDRARAADMLKYLDQMDQRAAARAAAERSAPAIRTGGTEPEFAGMAPQKELAGANPATETGRPVLQRATPQGAAGQKTTSVPADLLLSAEGTLVETGCGAIPTMVLQTAAGRKTFFVQDPNRIIVTGTPPALGCGAQAKPLAVRIQFTVADGAKSDGTVRAVHFPE